MLHIHYNRCTCLATLVHIPLSTICANTELQPQQTGVIDHSETINWTNSHISTLYDSLQYVPNPIKQLLKINSWISHKRKNKLWAYEWFCFLAVQENIEIKGLFFYTKSFEWTLSSLSLKSSRMFITCMIMQKEEETKHKKINDVDIL